MLCKNIAPTPVVRMSLMAKVLYLANFFRFYVNENPITNLHE